jgi:UDP-N-acetylmuramate dehydrogenase
MIAERTVDMVAPEAWGIVLRRDVPLAGLTTMKVGGKAEYFASVSASEQMIKLVRWCRSIELPYFILGGGSNILISDAGIGGLVIHNRCKEVRIDEAPPACFSNDERPYLFAESGAATAGVARISVTAGLCGFEWAVSVPGTIGGAVLGNAGAHGGEVKDNLDSALLIDDGGDIREYRQDELRYGYRDSSLKRLKPLRAAFKPVILSANFRLVRGDGDEIRARAEQYLNHRRRTQPVESSLGSTFVNPPGDFAGRLIEAAGLKGAQIGGASVSQMHANFIVNPGGVGSATASDVIRLMEYVQMMVERRFGVRLEPEIQLVGEWGLEFGSA